MSRYYDNYICKSGYTWDSIALEVYGNEFYSVILINMNTKYINTLIFEGGEVLIIPQLKEEQNEINSDIPPWRQ